MGLFDEITCKFPLSVDKANGLTYQTKDTPAQFCDSYEIREDGTLWHQAYDIEDQSDLTKWIKENPGKEPGDIFKDPAKSLFGCMARINQRWEREVNFTGEIRFYTLISEESCADRWIEWSAYFNEGKTDNIKLIFS